MEISDLIGIGKLGAVDECGYFHILLKPEYRAEIQNLADVYLIFNSDRVFFVTISDRKICDRKTWIRFEEDGIAEERKLASEVIVAIESQADDNDQIEWLIGASVWFENHQIGICSDFFFNNAQYVLVIQCNDKKEVMIPYVDAFIESVMENPAQICLRNARELIEL